jgi:putative transcriptional regulator
MNEYYDGKLLVAPPSMRDPRFANSVIYIWKHDVSGAAGVILNRPLEEPTWHHVCDEAGILCFDDVNPTMFYGGPAMEGIIGCLHTKDYCLKNSNGLYGNLNFTLDKKIIKDIARGDGPKNYIITMGVSSWEEGQLEEELEALPPRKQSESWLILDYDPNIIWHSGQRGLWNACVNMAVSQHSREFTSKLLRD